MSNTRYHSIGLKVKGNKNQIRVGSPMIGWERIQGGKAKLKRWVLSFERNVETDNELRVSGGREFQSLGAMTEKAFYFLPFYLLLFLPFTLLRRRWTDCFSFAEEGG